MLLTNHWKAAGAFVRLKGMTFHLKEPYGVRCHAPNMFGTMDIGIMSPAFRKLKSFFKNIFIGLEHLELRKRKIADIIPHAGYYEFKKDSDANNMTVQQYYRKMYNIHIK